MSSSHIHVALKVRLSNVRRRGCSSLPDEPEKKFWIARPRCQQDLTWDLACRVAKRQRHDHDVIEGADDRQELGYEVDGRDDPQPRERDSHLGPTRNARISAKGSDRGHTRRKKPSQILQDPRWETGSENDHDHPRRKQTADGNDHDPDHRVLQACMVNCWWHMEVIETMVMNRKEKERLPAKLKRSPAKAQDTYMRTLCHCGRSRMTKHELTSAIDWRIRAATSKATRIWSLE